jgi:DnaJ-class molecular chaperone
MEFTRSKKIVCPECKGVRYNHHSNNGMCMTCNGEGVI